MRNYILTILLFQTVLNYMHACVNDTLLEWNSDYRIKWSDFQGKPDSLMVIDSFKAVTSTFITRSYKKNGENFEYVVKCYFNKRKSWTVTNDSSILEHERIHFDIAELYNRKIIYAFDSLKASGCRDFELYDKVFLMIIDKHDARQEMYDNQTWLGTFRDIQAIWAEDIKVELKAYPAPRGLAALSSSCVLGCNRDG